MMSEVVIDAEGTVLGRMAVTAAEHLKDGDEVYVINAEEAIVTGDREEVFNRYRKKQEIGNRESGPHYPKAPEKILKRTIKGMLPKNKEGRQAFKRLRTYTGNPDELEADDTDTKTAADLQGRNYVSLQEIATHM